MKRLQWDTSIILLSVAILLLLICSKSAIACQYIPDEYYKSLTLEQTIATSTNIIIVTVTGNNKHNFGGFPVTSSYDWQEVLVIENIKGDLKPNTKIKLDTSDTCNYGNNFSPLEAGKKYLIFTNSPRGSDNLYTPVSHGQVGGVHQYVLNGDRIEVINITLDNLKAKIGIRDIKLLSPKAGDILSLDQHYTVEWKPEFADIKSKGTKIEASVFLLRQTDNKEIPISYGLYFDKGHLEKQIDILVKELDYSQAKVTPGTYKLVVKFSDVIPGKPCGIIEPGRECVPSDKIDYGQIAEASSGGNIIIAGQSSSKVSLIGAKDLKLGTNAPEVKILQKILNENDFIVSSSGLGSLGNEGMYFGELTRQALIKFQQKYGITPATGYLGPVTRAKMITLGM